MIIVFLFSYRQCSLHVVTSRPMPGGPWQEVAVDFKGPIGGTKGYYFHVAIDTYSRYPEVQVVKSTSFNKLEAVLDP